MLLAHRTLCCGDVRRYEVSYTQFLDKGITLKLPVVAVAAQTPAALSTVGSVSLNPETTHLIFYVTAAALPETFTANVQVQDTNGETINDTINFSVVASNAG